MQVAQANTQPKPAKELAFPSHGQKECAAKMNNSITNNKNGQLVTKAMCNKGFSGNSIVLPRIKFRVGGQNSNPQSLTAHSLNR